MLCAAAKGPHGMETVDGDGAADGTGEPGARAFTQSRGARGDDRRVLPYFRDRRGALCGQTVAREEGDAATGAAQAGRRRRGRQVVRLRGGTRRAEAER